MFNPFKIYVKSLVQLFYPNICLACSNALNSQEENICIVCEQRLPYTNFHLHESNPLIKKFWGRIDLNYIDSLLYFEKGSRTQELLHQLKYHGKQEIGTTLAEILIKKYDNAALNQKFDAIVSIPLHYKKLKRRGYNQCDNFCKKLSENWQIPYYPNAIIRNSDTITQTGKNRIDRWENVADIFSVNHEEILKNKHILLIDDVLTTGATIEACAQKILSVENTKLSVITMACKV